MISHNHTDFDCLKKYIFGHYLFSSDLKRTNHVSIKSFYDYVFGNKVQVKMPDHYATKKPKKNGQAIKIRQPVSIEEIQYRKEKKKQLELTNFVNSLNASIISNPDFRIMLREANAGALEIALYGNTTDILTKAQRKFPEDDKINQFFTTINSKYQYFNEQNEYYHSIKDKFIALFKGCKLIADYVENNNDANDSVAVLHAYKILVLFTNIDPSQNPFGKFEKFFQEHQRHEQVCPVHDTLVNNIPELSVQNIDLNGWQKLVGRYGQQTLEFFQNAKRIENILGNRAPYNLKEASETAAKVCYKSSHAYPELASLCIQFNASEEEYNKCLLINAHVKKHDNLPDIDIKGSVISPRYSRYNFVKLSFNDPHAFVLGHITKCCQKVGGHAEQCVIDGVTRENNGFYVLLKNKTQKDNSHYRLKNGNINYDKFDIVGQGYVYRTHYGNLTFDSWENLRQGFSTWSCSLLKLPETLNPDLCDLIRANKTNTIILYRNKLYFAVRNPHMRLIELSADAGQYKELADKFVSLKENNYIPANEDICALLNLIIGNLIDDDMIVTKMLKKFGELATAADTEIMQVTIGKGGKTPGEFKENIEFIEPEIAEEGYQYQDSLEQAVVYRNVMKRDQALSLLIEEIKAAFPAVSRLSRYDMDNLVNSNGIVSFRQLEWIRKPLLDVKYYSLWNEIITGIEFRDVKIINLFKNRKETWEIISYLHAADILTMENIKILADVISKNINRKQKSFWAEEKEDINFLSDNIRKSLHLLHLCKRLSDKKFKLLLKQAKYCKYFIKNMETLVKADMTSDEDIKLILKCEDHGKNFFNIQNAEQMDKAEIRIILENPEYGDMIANGINVLEEASLRSKENVNLILYANGKFAFYLAKTVTFLDSAEIYDNDNRNLLIDFIKANKDCDIHSLIRIIAWLASLNLLNDANLKSLLKKPHNVKGVELCLNFMDKSIILFNPENADKILERIEDANETGEILRHLYNANLLTKDNFLKITHLPAHELALIKQSIATLVSYAGSESLFTQIAFDQIIGAPEKSQELVEALTCIVKPGSSSRF